MWYIEEARPTKDNALSQVTEHKHNAQFLLLIRKIIINDQNKLK